MADLRDFSEWRFWEEQTNQREMLLGRGILQVEKAIVKWWRKSRFGRELKVE